MDIPEGQGFDLVVATNVLVYYDLFQQALAMSSIARMMNPGGIFLANHALPALHPKELEYLGGRSVKYTPSGAYGDGQFGGEQIKTRSLSSCIRRANNAL